MSTQKTPTRESRNTHASQNTHSAQSSGSPANRGPGPGRARGSMGGGYMAGMIKGEKAKDYKGSIRSLLLYLQPHIPLLVLVLFCAVLSTVFSIAGPMILGKATTLVYEGVLALAAGTGGIDFSAIAQIVAVLGVLYLASAVFAWVQGFVMSGIAMSVSASLRRDIDAKLHKLPFRYFDTHTYGEVLSHITNDVDTVTQSLSQSLAQIITSFTTLAGILVIMLVISLQMTLVALAVIPLSFVFVACIVGKSQPFFRSQQTGLAQINGHIEELYGSHLVTKAFNGEKAALAEFDRINTELYAAGWKSQFLSGLMMPVMGFIGNLGYVAVCILGGYLAVKGSLAVGNIQAFIQYVRQFNQPVTQIANTSNILQSMAAASERIFALLAEAEETSIVKPAGVTGTSGAVRGEVVFDHVRFGYVPDTIVINDFSVTIAPGQKAAIVGPTGAGKTTIVKLLMRFYDLESGSILIDGVPVETLPRETVRESFGMVLQDTWLYNASILENIRYGNLAATDEQVYAAARSAQAEHFIHTLPGGYEFVLNEEASNISRGQKQLLTIARAFLANPRILILDEATSSVDTLTEVLIQKAMDSLMHGRTSFVIAHRLSTIRNADVILVMNEGDIIEQGTHGELLAAGGFYSQLYQSQFESEEE